MLRPGLQILSVCGILGMNFEAETWDVCRDPGLKAFWIIKGVFSKGKFV